MAFYSNRAGEKRKLSVEDQQLIGGLCRLSGLSPKDELDDEKKIRREIANSNERRRMQSINAGFNSLRTLLPHNEGEKLSKAAILQQTAEYIYQLEQDKTRLLAQNCQLKRLAQQEGDDCPPPKRKRVIVEGMTVVGGSESGDEGLGSMSPEHQEELCAERDIVELRMQLDKERRLRMLLEEQVRSIEQQLLPDAYKHTQHSKPADKKENDAKHILNINLSPVSSPRPEEPAVKVAVERVPSPSSAVTSIEDSQSVHDKAINTSRQNLETIVEAIRHLEGDHLFNDEPREEVVETTVVEMNPTALRIGQQNRPGVIVVQHV